MAASTVYDPDPGVIEATRFSALLSQRDVSIQVPVNYVSQPGVVLAAACFGNGTYEDAATAKCVSNLLAMGFRRLEADVYWDASRGHWQLCPVQLGVAEDPLTSSVSIPSLSPSASVATFNALLSTGIASAAGQKRQNDEQLTASTPTSTASVSSIPSASRTLTLDAGATTVASSDPPTSQDDTSVIRIGSYYCSPTSDFDLLMDVINGYLDSTETDLNATTLILSLNIHAAAPATVPLRSALQPAEDQLPTFDSLLSTRIQTNDSTYLYTPTDLLSQRQNLNASQSWFGVPARNRPVSSYFQVVTTDGTTSTPDGWPSQSYVQMSAVRRLMVQFGDVDPQMASYNFDGDASTIFPSNYLTSTPPVDASSTGAIVSGCLFDPSITTISTLNSSWAVNTVGSGSISSLNDLPPLLTLGSTLTNCGFSPLLNQTLNSTTADSGYLAYQLFASSAAIWSWGANQPINASESDSTSNDRCAVLDATSGKWSAGDCGEPHHAACRVRQEPYVWRISSARPAYDRSDQVCDQEDEDSTFDVPRTVLENAHLLSAWRLYRTNAASRPSPSDDDDDRDDTLLYLNFNQLDLAGCWVRGSNTTCPYRSSPQDDTRRIAVPVVGAVIVLGLSVLTVLVKCAGNRTTARRRRKRMRGKDEGWDYEGVPS